MDWTLKWGRWLFGALVAGLLILVASPAFAHTGFESSSPAEGDVVDQPVFEISLTFSGEASPVGDGFVILDPAGVVRVPDSVTTNDNRTWTLRFDEPLTGGEVGVRWNVAATDAHPIGGSFSFTVSALAPTTTTEPPPTTQMPSTTSVPATSTAPIDSETSPEVVAETPVDQASAVSEVVDLDEFLLTESDTEWSMSLMNSAGRVLSLLGVVGAVGGMVFATWVLRGDRTDIHAVLSLVRIAGVIVAVGSVVEAAATTATLGGGWSAMRSGSALGDALWSSFGVAVGLRLLGGAAVAAGITLAIKSAASVEKRVSVNQLTPVGVAPATAVISSNPEGAAHAAPVRHQARAPRPNPVAIAGVVLLVGSFLFDGHTVSEGPRWLHALINPVHVAAGATWAGGVVMLAVVLGRRSRRGVPTQAQQLAVRFSVVATVALVAVAAAGAVLSFIILDSVSEAWSTPWGRLLIVKVALVAVAAAGGGYNHRVLVPALDRAPHDPELSRSFRTVVTLEAVVLVAIAAVTALLVGASSA
jgi:copper transport protein